MYFFDMRVVLRLIKIQFFCFKRLKKDNLGAFQFFRFFHPLLSQNFGRAKIPPTRLFIICNPGVASPAIDLRHFQSHFLLKTTL